MIVKPKKVIRTNKDITVYCSNDKTYKLSTRENRGSIFPKHTWIDIEDSDIESLTIEDVMQIIAGRLDRE
jgi:hypothetical protein